MLLTPVFPTRTARMVLAATALLLARPGLAGTFVYTSSGNSDPLVSNFKTVTASGSGPSAVATGTALSVPSLNGTVTATASANDLTGIDRVLASIDLGPTPDLASGQSSAFASASFSSSDLTLFPTTGTGTGTGMVHVTASFSFDGTIDLVSNTQGTFTGDLQAALDPLQLSTFVGSHLDFIAPTPGATPHAFGNGTYTVDKNAGGAAAGTLTVGLDVTPGTPFYLTAMLYANIDIFDHDQAGSGTIDGFHTGTLSLSEPSGYTLVSPSGTYGLPTSVPSVPLPAPWLSMMTGLGVFGVAARRRRAPAAT